MIGGLKIFFGKRKYLYGLLIFTFISLICVAFSVSGNNDFDIARREILLRRIGHEVLLQSGDSTSRVLPVKKIAENEYQINFEQAFTFEPEFLVNTTQRLLGKDPLTNDYVVNVLNCDSADVAYGYAISQKKAADIVSCIGREQLKACYKINIKFEQARINITNRYLLGSLVFLVTIGFIFWRAFGRRKPLPVEQDTDMFTLGSVLFDANNKKLIINESIIELTGTETRVLRIFALSPNEAIERSRLQKEIWEDEGVIVGRSLDMFISKLRKKLELDPNIKIVVIRSKGYKLEIIT
jgi:Transcriptional regulatory protein, C terminal